MKWALPNEDKDDFEQEKLIQEWLKREGKASEFGYQYINNKGNARNTLIKASVSLDQKIQEDDGGTYADIIAGCDGRDMERGIGAFRIEEDPGEKISRDLSALGLMGRDATWVTKILKLSESRSYKRYLKFRTNLAWLKRLKLFSE